MGHKSANVKILNAVWRDRDGTITREISGPTWQVRSAIAACGVTAVLVNGASKAVHEFSWIDISIAGGYAETEAGSIVITAGRCGEIGNDN